MQKRVEQRNRTEHVLAFASLSSLLSSFGFCMHITYRRYYYYYPTRYTKYVLPSPRFHFIHSITCINIY